MQLPILHLIGLTMRVLRPSEIGFTLWVTVRRKLRMLVRDRLPQPLRYFPTKNFTIKNGLDFQAVNSMFKGLRKLFLLPGILINH